MKKEWQKQYGIFLGLLIAEFAVYFLTIRNEKLVEIFANSPKKIYAGEYYRLFTYGFFHGSLSHLTANMLSLYGLFDVLREKRKGFFFIFFVTLPLAGLFSAVMHHSTGDNALLIVGASGGVYGILGAIYAYIFFDGESDFLRKMSYFKTAVPVSIILCHIFIRNIDTATHLGGFLAGFVLGLLFCKRKTMETQEVS